MLVFKTWRDRAAALGFITRDVTGFAASVAAHGS